MKALFLLPFTPPLPTKSLHEAALPALDAVRYYAFHTQHVDFPLILYGVAAAPYVSVACVRQQLSRACFRVILEDLGLTAAVEYEYGLV